MTPLHNSEADLEARKLPSAIELLADELGAVAGRVERELRQECARLRAENEAFRAVMAEKFSAIELTFHKAEQERDRIWRERLAELRDGRDGDSGKDADEEALRASLVSFLEERLAQVRDGKDGEPGPPGEPGRDGVDGKDGRDGIDGKDGKLPIVREWKPGVHYAGDVVRHSGATFQALVDTGDAPPSDSWGELACRGQDGSGFSVRGPYDGSAEYRAGDIVMFGSSSFVARYDAPGVLPGDGWQLWAGAGKRGKEGPPGPRGERGADGASIMSASVDPESLEVLVSTGERVVKIDLAPIAERILEEAR